MTAINFNGRTYNSLDEMPANERMAYEQMMQIFVDKNGNGIPDFLEGDMVQNVLKAHSTNISIGGNMVHSLNDLTPEARESVENAFKMLSQLGILPKDVPSSAYTQSAPAISREPKMTSKPFVSREYNPTIQEEKSNLPLIIVLVSLVVLMCFGAAAVLLFLRLG